MNIQSLQSIKIHETIFWVQTYEKIYNSRTYEKIMEISGKLQEDVQERGSVLVTEESEYMICIIGF